MEGVKPNSPLQGSIPKAEVRHPTKYPRKAVCILIAAISSFDLPELQAAALPSISSALQEEEERLTNVVSALKQIRARRGATWNTYGAMACATHSIVPGVARL
ncbi:hypothetical protein HAX54_039014 [Datura stramonium]|uniref:Uncharacterized protein n=1 Tax=Datura stramonium TaxID=4076 RepID=A0ABS8VLY0_DATST|nr:hypothetical protein [Datura stramonium]